MAKFSGRDGSIRDVSEERIDREREFHNVRFARDTREAQDKY